MWSALTRLFFYEAPHVLRADERLTLQKVPYLRRMTREQQQRFLDLSHRFLQEVRIEGLEGHQPTDEERAWAAASCALLFAGRPEWRFPPVKHVFVSPMRFEGTSWLPHAAGEYAGLFTSAESYGESSVSLHNFNLSEAFGHAADGYNVGVHEFAHAIDSDAGVLNGVPMQLPDRHIQPWIEALERARNAAGSPGYVLREYAKKSPSETFAVLVEAFFEQPRCVRNQCCELYGMLAELLALDPAAADDHTLDIQLRFLARQVVEPFVVASRANQRCVPGRLMYQNCRGKPELRVSFQTQKGGWCAPIPLPPGCVWQRPLDSDATRDVRVVLEKGRPYHIALPDAGHPVREDAASHLVEELQRRVPGATRDECHSALRGVLQKQGFHMPSLASPRPLD